jgi:hypothetical protein
MKACDGFMKARFHEGLHAVHIVIDHKSHENDNRRCWATQHYKSDSHEKHFAADR